MFGEIALQDVACVRGGRVLFSDLSLWLGPGDAALIMGRNGVGKSSLLRLIAGLLPPSAGQCHVRGPIALVDGRLALDQHQPLGKALGFWQRLDDRVEEDGLARFGIAHLASVPVFMLSAGQKQRAACARAWNKKADIWLLDEPSTALDAAGVGLLEQAMATHRARGGIAVVTSHVPIMLPGAVQLDLGA